MQSSSAALAEHSPPASNSHAKAVIQIEKLVKSYGMAGGAVTALKGVSFTIRQGEFASIMGQSGSGKSTLLHVVGCLHRSTSGSYKLDGIEVSTLNDDELSQLRNSKIGFVFQKFNLLPQENIVENVALPLVYAGVPRTQRNERAVHMLELVGLGDRLHHKPSELSGGQSQRVAIARALVTEPAVILADEPTGNLDSRTGEEIMALFQALHRTGRTIVQVTHDQEKAEYSERIVRLKDGEIDKIELVATPRQAPRVSLNQEAPAS